MASEPMTPERLTEIRRNEAEVAEYITEGLMRSNSAFQDRTDLLAEVERLRVELKVSFGPSLYFDIQKVLDKALGTEESDGAGAGIVADVALVVERMRAAEAEVTRLNRVVASLGSQLQGGAEAYKLDLRRLQESHEEPPLIDPDCRDGKCSSCVGGPCQHSCHAVEPGGDT